MFKKIHIISMAFTFFAVTASVASVVDAPHNGSNDVNCSSCHSYSLWWRYSPTNQSLTPSKSTIVNDVCNACHDGSKAQIPTQRPHSSTIIGSSLHGTWDTACVDCHDPHYQGQLGWRSTYASGLYLVQGTISAVSAGTVANTTNLSYSNVPVDNLSGDWTDRSRWGKKNANPDLDRGLILVVDRDNVENTYQVVSADSTAITVKGTVSLADTGKSFGLIYGQLIKKVISTPSSGERQVTFFDPNTLYGQGGFTDQQTPRQGICQVCHTKTTHWTEDALHDGHNATFKCTNCHDAVQGFKSSLPTHGFLTNTTPCTNCHQHLADDPLAIHGNTCTTCHSTPPLLRTDSGNFHNVTRIGMDPAGTALGNGKTATSCTYCHSAYFSGHTHSHATAVKVNDAATPLTANCRGCHSATLSPFIGSGEAHAVSGCATCHELTTNGGLKGSAASATAPYGECITCHAGYFASHDHGTSGGNQTHAVSLGSDTYSGQSCAVCHNATNGNLVSWNDISVEHQSNCGFCHNSNRTANVRPPFTSVADVIAQADAQHPVTCLDCHATHSNDHQTRYVSAYEDGGLPTPVVLTTCAVNCHSSIFSTSAADPKRHDSCKTCHTATATPVTLIGSALGQTVPEAHAFNTCYTCHGADYFPRHSNVNHSSVVNTTTDNTCERCHTGDAITSASIHRGNCDLCHDPARGGVLISLAAIATGNCNSCHGSNWLTIHATTPNVDHSQKVAMATVCSACHAATAGTPTGIAVDPLNNTIHDGCNTCHDSTGLLIGIAAGHGGNADCISCHGNFGAGAHSTVNHAARVAMSEACSSCHPGANGTATGMTLDAANPKQHHACASCHGATGALSGSAIGKTGNNDCVSCHGLFAAKHSDQNHSLTVAMATDCSGCHAGAQGGVNGMVISSSDPKMHYSCSSCHDTTGALIGIAAGKGGGADCNTCHGSFASKHMGVSHALRVSLSPECATCHSGTAGTVSGIPTSVTDNATHDDCRQCHGLDGVLIGSASSHGATNACADCHDTAAQHTALHFVQINETTDRGLSTNQACNACHGIDGGDAGTGILDAWSEVLALHGANNCAVCHGTSREVLDNQGHSQVPVKTVADIIAAAANPTSCLACHLDKQQPAEHGFDHIVGGIVSVLDRCVSCHTNPNLLTGIHTANGCKTCHDRTTAPVVLKGSAVGHGKDEVISAGVPNTCGTCHSTHAANFLNHTAPDHVARGFVINTTNSTCDDCHTAADTIVSDFMHKNNCANCHTATPGGVNDGKLTGSAAGKLNGGNCTTCHTIPWLAIHQGANPAIDHLTQVGMATECSSCHAGAAGTASGMPVDINEPRLHSGCVSCHDDNGDLVGLATGNLGPNTCSDCHGSFSVKHAAFNHSTFVSMANDCSGCHTAVGNTVDPNNPKVHDSCAQCHGTDGSLVGSAAGHSGGGDCNICHGSFASIHANTDHSYRVALAANCADCHSGTAGTASGIPTNSADNKVHDACSQCHGATGTLIASASGREGATLGSPNDCATCHGIFTNNHASVNHSTMVSMDSNCTGCHIAVGNTVIPGDPKAHQSCASCHSANGRLLGAASGKDGTTLGGSDGGGSCSACHGGFANNHASVNHDSRVAMATECSGCHTATGNTVNPADPKVHNACVSCHAANGALAGSASGHLGGGACTVCHSSFPTVHANQDHNLLVGLSTDCSGCHAGSQGTVSGMPVGGSTLRHGACSSCHGTTGALVSIAAGKGGGAECDSCHGVFAAKHSATDHSFSVALATNCADCHSGTEGTASGLPVSLSDNKIHDACSQCHGTTGTLIGSASGKEGATSGSPNDCSSCHGIFTNNHASVNHSTTVSMNSNCTGCHTAVGSTVIPGDPKAHQACASCHDANGRLLGAASGKDGATLGGKDGGGDCALCHGGFANNHASVNHDSRVAMATECSGCHTATGNTVNPADPKVHDACLSCHAANGALAGSASGHLGGGACVVCHGSFPTVHANQNHNLLVGLSTDCSGCHAGSQGTVSGMPVGGSPLRHGACSSCHGTTGALVSIAAGKGGGAECDSCHGVFAAKHSATDHSFSVALATNCADCHTGTAGSAAGIPLATMDNKVHDACSQCHGTTGTLIGSASGKEGATSGSPNDCSSCHGIFTNNHASVNHSTVVSMDSNCTGCHTAVGSTVIPGDPKAHQACASCHSANGRLLGAATSKDGATLGGSDGGGSCSICHGGFVDNHASVNHDSRVAMATECSGCHTATGNTVNPADPKVHGACLSCHAVNGVLAGSASGHLGGGSCTVCHSGFATVHATQDHSSLISLSTDCSGCHTGAQGTAGGMPVGVSALRHSACSSCHGTTGALVSIAIGKGGGADCDSCHGLFAAKHAVTDHSYRVWPGSNCTDCHAGTAGTVSGIPISLTDNKVHDSCSQCHGTTGTLIGLASGKEGATSASPNYCSTCHGGFASNHATVNHSAMVSMADHCSGCHTATGNSVNPADPRVHDGCTSCHGVDGKLVNIAAGKDGGSVGGSDGGGACTVCHGEYLPNHQSANHDYRTIYFGSELTCSECHTSDSSHLGFAGTGTLMTHNDVNMLHNRVTGDGCSLCHYYDEATQANPEGLPLWNTVKTAIVDGTNAVTDATCVVCHDYNMTVVNHSTDHSYRVALAPNCADCHAGTAGSVTGIPTSATNNKVHDACSQCHGTTGTLTGSATGKQGATSGNPNDCSTCHGGFASNHATVNHSAMVSMNSNCLGCHTESGNTVIPGDSKAHQACSSCHDANGRLLGAASGKDGATIGGSDGGGDCSTCHGGFGNNHDNVNHDAYVSMAAECSGCHTATGKTVDPADPKVHDACATCHEANGSLVGSAMGHVNGGDCTVCHGHFADRHVGADHSYRVQPGSNCIGCHTATGGTASGIPVSLTDNKVHDSCSQCHGTTGTLIGSASGKEGATSGSPNFCASCHGSFANNHAVVTHSSMVSMADHCSGCHTASGNTVNPADPRVHDGCTSCHGVDGSLVSLAAGKDAGSVGGTDGGGDCIECHGEYLPNHQSVDHNYRSIYFGSELTCSECHTSDSSHLGFAGTGSLLTQDDVNMLHSRPTGDGCALCHYYDEATQANPEGRPLWNTVRSAIVNGTNAETDATCVVCHDYNQAASSHNGTDHAYRVSLAPDCADCHTGTAGSASGIPTSTTDNKVHDACTQCHGASGTLIGSATGKEGASSGSPNDCSTCHGVFTGNHATVNHSTMVSMNSNCSGCHTESGNTVIPGDSRAHQACSSCHDANGRLRGVASGHDGTTIGGSDGGGDCSTCHGGFGNNHNNINHDAYVSMATECSGCHTATGKTVDPADPKVHDSCAACHGANGSLVGSASGHINGGDCSVCHGSFATIHATVNHSFRVALASDCVDCHTGTEGNATGIPLNSADNKKHDDCASCHGVTGTLTGSASGKEGATVTIPNTCNTCHDLFTDNHATVSHETMVRLDSNDHCSGCHTEVGNTVNPADPRVHDACTSCHAANGRLIGTAAGKDGGTLGGTNGGGDCIICHGEYLPNHQSVDASGNHHRDEVDDHYRSIYGGSGNCSACHTSDSSVLGNPGDGSGTLLTQNDVDSLHTRITGDSCSLCHYYNVITQANAQGLPLWNTVRSAIIDGTNKVTDATCVVCHSSNVSNHPYGYYPNLAPSFSPATISKPDATTNAAYTGQTIAGAATDPESNPITYSKVSGPAWLTVAADGALGGTPTMTGSDNFVVAATATGGTGYASLTVAVGKTGNQAPKFTQTTFTKANASTGSAYSSQSIAGAATDQEGDAIIYAKMSGPAWLTIAADGTLSGTPTIAGDDSFVVRATATGGTGDAVLNITVVVGSNQPPTFSQSSFSKPNASMNVAYSGESIAGAASDPDFDAITYSKVSGPAWLTVGTDGTLSGTPPIAANDSFVVRATATGGTADATLNITVVNQPPIFTSSPFSTSDASANVAYTGQTIAGAATDPNGDTITYSKVSGPGWLTVGTDGTLSGTPPIAANDSFVVRATATGGTADATLNITVVNQPPAFTSSPFSKGDATAGVAYTGQTIAGAATDPNTDTITYSKVSGPAWLTVGTDGTLGGTPTTAASDSFVVRATATGGTADATLNITVVALPVSQLNNWTSLASFTNLGASRTNYNVGTTFAVGSGTNRLMLVSVNMETGTAENKTISVSYGGVALTQIGVTANTQREIVWMGYLKDTQIGSGLKQVQLTYGGTATVSGCNIRWASYSGVNQTTPIPASGSSAVNVASNTVTFGANINYVNKGMTIVVSGNGGNTITACTLNATPAFGATPLGSYTSGNGHSYTVLTTATHSADGSYPAGTSVVWTGNGAWSALVVVSLQP